MNFRDQIAGMFGIEGLPDNASDFNVNVDYANTGMTASIQYARTQSTQTSDVFESDILYPEEGWSDSGILFYEDGKLPIRYTSIIFGADCIGDGYNYSSDSEDLDSMGLGYAKRVWKQTRNQTTVSGSETTHTVSSTTETNTVAKVGYFSSPELDGFRMVSADWAPVVDVSLNRTITSTFALPPDAPTEAVALRTEISDPTPIRYIPYNRTGYDEFNDNTEFPAVPVTVTETTHGGQVLTTMETASIQPKSWEHDLLVDDGDTDHTHWEGTLANGETATITLSEPKPWRTLSDQLYTAAKSLARYNPGNNNEITGSKESFTSTANYRKAVWTVHGPPDRDHTIMIIRKYSRMDTAQNLEWDIQYDLHSLKAGTTLTLTEEADPGPDYDTVTVQLDLLPVEIVVDANRNGEVEFGTDQTSSDEPYVFWVNNDQDDGTDDKADDLGPDSYGFTAPDCNDIFINGWRDLEDFARIQISTNGLLKQLKTGEVTAILKFREGTIQGNPSVNLWLHLDPDGGRDYVENEASAQLHSGGYRPRGMEVGSPASINNPGPGVVLKNYGYTFRTDFWDGSVSEPYPEATKANPKRFLLFEGASEGRGELVLEFRRGEEILAEGGSCWIELKDVKRMYEEYSVGGVHGKTWQQINEIAPTASTREMTTAQKSAYQDYDLPSVFEYQAPDHDTPDYEKDYILFVHGWRMKPSEKYAFAETAFKRLWHRGYRGRFGILAWPTEWTSRPVGTALWDVMNYDRSDRKAMLSAAACQKLFRRLDAIYPGRVRVFAHSMGNVMVSEALKIEASQADSRQTIHSYVACQAASVAHAYDAIGPEMITADLLDSKPSFDGVGYSSIKNVISWIENGPEIETYGNYPPTGEPLYNEIRIGAGNIVNFHNRNDDALAWWLLNQLQKPDGSMVLNLGVPDGKGWGYANILGDEIDGPIWFRSDGIPYGWSPLNFHDDTPEIHAHIAEANSPPLGAAVGDGHDVENVISGRFDLMTDLSPDYRFTSREEDHSAEFRSINMRRYEFWDRMLRRDVFFGITTDYPLLDE